MKKILLIGAAVVVIGTLGYFAMTSDATQTVKVYADEVTNREVTEVVSASGRIQPKTKVDITSEINGEIVALPVREGDRVRVGDMLVVLDTVQLRSDVDQALYARNEINARLEGAKTQLDQATEEYDRQQRLFDGKLTSETQYKNAKYAFLNAKTSYEAMDASAKQFQSRYEKQLDNLEKAKIVAPMPGVVTFLDCEVGEIAAAQNAYSQGKTLMTISDLDIFEVEVEVDETEIAKIAMSQEASIEVDAFPDTTFVGEVVEIGNTAIYSGLGTQDQSTNFRVKVVFSEFNPKVRPGMSATVDITANKREETLTIPFSAVVMRTYDMDSLEMARAGNIPGEQESGEVHAAETDEEPVTKVDDDDDEPEELKGVFVIRDGKALFVEVTTGIADQKHIECLSGLQVGDTVISGPYRMLRTIKDSDAVELIEKNREED